MRRGHVTGTKRERRMRPTTQARYEAIGAAIAASFVGKTTEELLGLATPAPEALTFQQVAAGARTSMMQAARHAVQAIRGTAGGDDSCRPGSSPSTSQAEGNE